MYLPHHPQPPDGIKDADTVKYAGAESIHQTLDDARTQHKGRIIEETKLITVAVANNDWHNDLGKIRKWTTGAVGEERELFRPSIKGLGRSGLDIFHRRIQWLWDEAFVFVGARTQA